MSYRFSWGWKPKVAFVWGILEKICAGRPSVRSWVLIFQYSPGRLGWASNDSWTQKIPAGPWTEAISVHQNQHFHQVSNTKKNTKMREVKRFSWPKRKQVVHRIECLQGRQDIHERHLLHNLLSGMKRKRAVDVSTCAEGFFDLQVLCLTGEGLTLNVHHTTLGWEVHRMVSEQLPYKRGTTFALHHMEPRLVLHKTLHEQNITGAATLSCTRMPVNVYDAWCYVTGLRQADENALDGLTKLHCAPPGVYLRHLPQTLQMFTLGNGFD